MTDILDTVLGVGNTPMTEYMYIRAELRTERDYTGFESEYMTSFDVFHSVTNPIWFKFDDVTGLNAVQLQSNIKVYPNPTESELHFVFGEASEFSIIIYDQFGRLIKKLNGHSNMHTVNLSSTESGIYYANVLVDGNSHQFRFVKL